MCLIFNVIQIIFDRINRKKVQGKWSFFYITKNYLIPVVYTLIQLFFKYLKSQNINLQRKLVNVIGINKII